MSLVGQWIAEAQAKLGGSLKMHMYHGNGRIRDPVRLATQFDLVCWWRPLAGPRICCACLLCSRGGLLKGARRGVSCPQCRLLTVAAAPLTVCLLLLLLSAHVCAGGDHICDAEHRFRRQEGQCAAGERLGACPIPQFHRCQGSCPWLTPQPAPCPGLSCAPLPYSLACASRLQNFPPLGAIEWHRLVLDEAHTVKNAAVGHSKACVALKSERRWMCTGEGGRQLPQCVCVCACPLQKPPA